MSSAICGKLTPGGAPCRRPVKTPGGACGVTHPAPLPQTGAAPSGAFQAGPDPLNPLLPPDPGGGPTQSAGASPEALAAFADHPDWRQRLVAASGQRTPADVLVRLVADPEHSVRTTALRNPGIPPDVLGRVAADPDTDTHLRLIVAGHPRTPPEVLARLAADPERLVRKKVAGNRSAPVETLAVVDTYRPRHTRVDAELAGNPRTPPDVLAALASSKSVHVRHALAGNPATPTSILDRLRSSSVTRTAHLAEAGHPATTPARLGELARDDSQQVRRRIAERADLPPGTLAVLANDDDETVTAAARANPAFTATEAAHAGLLAD